MKRLLCVLALAACSSPTAPGECARKSVVTDLDVITYRDELHAGLVAAWMDGKPCLVIELFADGASYPEYLLFQDRS